MLIIKARSWGYIFLSVALLLLTLPPFRQSWAAGVALVPLLLSIKKGNPFWKNFIFGLLVGTFYYAIGLHWIAYYKVSTYFIVLLCHLPFLGLFLGSTGLILKRWPENTLAHFLVPPAIWFSLSFIYEQTSLGGVGTQALFYQSIVWMQICRYVGIQGFIFLFVMLNSSLAIAFKLRSLKGLIPLVLTGALLAGVFLWGERAVAETFPAEKPVALIQHNFPGDPYWWVRNQHNIPKQYRTLALEAVKQKPSLIIFPSYRLPFDAYRDPRFFEDLARETGTYLLLDTYIPAVANRRMEEVGRYEVALLFSPEGKLAGMDKAVQGPPFRRIGQVFGEESELLDTPLGKTGTLLCFEDVFSSHAKEDLRKGAELLVALSNPRHFTKTFIPEYHLFQDQLRAIETGLFVIRLTANGYSAVIDPRGRVLKRTELGKQEILYVNV